MRAAIQKGERATNGHIRALRRFNAQSANDPYGHLLLAAIYANRGWALDALDQYDLAYQIDPSTRGAPEMLAHALKLVGAGLGEGDAERFIEKAYGREAQTAIAGALRERGLGAAAVQRLKSLQGRIAAGKRAK
jgi:cytochrome c-type biogenesis protein CcmH/NrfG